MGRLAFAAALPTLALAVSAPAQVPGPVQDYRLPPASPSPRPTAAGPVDSDHPVAAPTTPTPTSTPSPVIALPSPAATAPAAQASPAPTPRAAPPPSPSPRTAASSPPAASPAAMAPALPPPTLPTPTLPTTAATEPPAVAASASPPPAAPTETTAYWPWVAGGAVLLGLLGALLLRRRRPPEDEAADYEPELAEPAETRPDPPAIPPPPLPPAEPRPLDMQLEARHLSRAMVNATLAYRLVLTNRAPTATGPLRIAGDIVSAHASLSAAEQLAPGEAALVALHEVPSLAPGETVALSGELRLPIASILPINSAGNRVFVPLARFRAEPQAGAATTRVFVVGQASDQPGGALRPFPLDRGPGVDRGLGQRELEMPA